MITKRRLRGKTLDLTKMGVIRKKNDDTKKVKEVKKRKNTSPVKKVKSPKKVKQVKVVSKSPKKNDIAQQKSFMRKMKELVMYLTDSQKKVVDKERKAKTDAT